MIEYRVGDVFARLAEIPDGSIDLVLTSPPFLALRSYLPADHPDKGLEIGSEADPAAFIDTLLRLTAEWRRVLAPHGSICIELGDTYSGSGGSGGDYNDGGLREGQQTFSGSAAKRARLGVGDNDRPGRAGRGIGWPLAKSICGIPWLYTLSLAYGRNLLNPEHRIEPWRVRNVVAWCRPNPPVGCVDDQTEALTLDGWKHHDELIDGDLIAAYDPKTDSCRFLPASFVRWHRENEAMVAIDKRVATSQRLTEDHRCWTRTRKTDPHVRLARDLTNDCETLLCAPFDDVPGYSPVSIERAALLGWFIAEGTAVHHQSRIVQSLTANPQKVAEIRRLLEIDGADFYERHYVTAYNDSTIVTFVVKGELAEWLNLHHKRLPMQYVTSWPEAQAKALFDALIDGDGHRRKNADGVLFHQQDERVLDAVQVLALRLGYRAIKTYQTPMRIWQLTMSRDSERRSVRWTKIRTWEGEGIRRESYTGVVWCPQIETTYWLARRNGRTFITGNSLGDKFRPATSYLTIACVSSKRYFDLDAVRTDPKNGEAGEDLGEGPRVTNSAWRGVTDGGGRERILASHPAGAPPLDYWEISTQPYKGSHYATFPEALLERPILSMVPRTVCLTCGEPSRRIVGEVSYARTDTDNVPARLSMLDGTRVADMVNQHTQSNGANTSVIRQAETVGWTDCGHDNNRTGIVLDPFGGSGTTGVVAQGHGRDAILIDLDERNAELARDRVGMFLTVTT